MEKYTIHSGSAADIDFLWEMLYQAIYVPEGVDRPSRAIIKDPALEKYVRNWGRDGDIALIALDETGNHVGAIWTRLFNEKNQTYGYIADDTPVLSMAVLPDYRGKGIGTLLLNELLRRLTIAGYPAVSLSVDPNNTAVQLYKRFGFIKVGLNGTSWDMKAELHR
ncbi:MAG: GNAT family N-acetyltransferase [Bacillota bacterium]|nr:MULTISPECIES: GNAT family N-acetyltransferase [unclassified Virgibacillus]MCC2251194.1 GNAT family N-acetyltransferase [Virgibacillus sp. AGTR]MDY7045520.1 GNAT family N-acetyltransferase [Virgibacillus sp. M23]QRZ18723.1 GNAT family N-acetyltransferase [Virgibacillus sp. AGTR]